MKVFLKFKKSQEHICVMRNSYKYLLSYIIIKGGELVTKNYAIYVNHPIVN